MKKFKREFLTKIVDTGKLYGYDVTKDSFKNRAILYYNRLLEKNANWTNVLNNIEYHIDNAPKFPAFSDIFNSKNKTSDQIMTEFKGYDEDNYNG